MATGDRVMMLTVVNAIVNQGGFYGEFLVGVLQTADDPAVILWENGLQATCEVALLLKVLDPAASTHAKLGKWLRMDDWPLLESDEPNDATPKSPGMSGVCVRALAVGALGSEVINSNLVQIAMNGGRSFAAQDIDPALDPLEQPAFVIFDGRRRV